MVIDYLKYLLNRYLEHGGNNKEIINKLERFIYNKYSFDLETFNNETVKWYVEKIRKEMIYEGQQYCNYVTYTTYEDFFIIFRKNKIAKLNEK